MIAGLPLVVLTLIAAVLSAFAKREKLVIFWLLFSGVVHILLEGSYGLHHTEVRTKATTTFMDKMLEDVSPEKFVDTHWWASLYGQYARYDGRYAVSDPMVIFFCWTELVEGILCFALIGLVLSGSKYRHPMQIMCSTAQFYGTIIYFIAPIIYGNWDQVMTADKFELWVYVIALNGLWMVVPGLLIIQSFVALTRSPAKAAATPSSSNKKRN